MYWICQSVISAVPRLRGHVDLDHTVPIIGVAAFFTKAGNSIKSENMEKKLRTKTYEGGGGDDILLCGFSLLGLESSACNAASA